MIAEVADAVAVMYLGRIVEFSDTRTIFRNPRHPYTQRLLKAIPTLTRRASTYLENIAGNVPVPLDPPAECGFFSRCTIAQAGLLIKAYRRSKRSNPVIRCAAFWPRKEPVARDGCHSPGCCTAHCRSHCAARCTAFAEILSD
ncbi:MAG: hypothetical protein R3E79_00775 [Caldilineaceae bacterium]